MMLRLVCALAAVVWFANPVAAQVSSTVFRSAALVPPGQPTRFFSFREWTFSIGLAAVAAPAWWGSKDYALSIYPDIRANFRDDVFFSVPDGLGWNAINRNDWKLGPLVKPRMGRGEGKGHFPFQVAGGSLALVGMGDIKAALEFGGFAQKTFFDNKLQLRAELRHGAGGNRGTVADTVVTWADGRDDDSLFWYVSARAGFADRSFSQVYFGVNPQQAARTGLPVSYTGSGLISSSISGTVIKPLGREGRYGGIIVFASYERLGSPVARSSLIRERGDANQFVGGIAYGIRFGGGTTPDK